MLWAFVRYLEMHPQGRKLVDGLQADPALVDPELRIPLAQAASWLEHAIEVTGDQAIGLHAASLFEPTDRDLLDAAARSCSTLEAALRCTIRYISLISHEATYSLETVGGSSVFCRHSTATGMHLRVSSDFALLDMVQFLRRNATVDESEYSVEFAHAEPDYEGEYRKLFHCRLQFSAGRNALVFSPEHLNSPMKTPCSVLEASFARRAEGQLLRLLDEGTLTSRVRRLVMEHLRTGQVTMDWTAHLLGMSSPTLRRQLESESTTYSDIVEQVRREAAEHQLRSKRNIGEIAFELGFSSVSAFDRAFKRWYSVLPSEYRARAKKTTE